MRSVLRLFSSSTPRVRMVSTSRISLAGHHNTEPVSNKTVSITFVDKSGNRFVAEDARVGENILKVAHRHMILMPGQCGGKAQHGNPFYDGPSCTSCHVVLPKGWYERLGKPEWKESMKLEEVNDSTPTSRLGCQITVDESMDGMIISVPSFPDTTFEREDNQAVSFERRPYSHRDPSRMRST